MKIEKETKKVTIYKIVLSQDEINILHRLLGELYRDLVIKQFSMTEEQYDMSCRMYGTIDAIKEEVNNETM